MMTERISVTSIDLLQANKHVAALDYEDKSQPVTGLSCMFFE